MRCLVICGGNRRQPQNSIAMQQAVTRRAVQMSRRAHALSSARCDSGAMSVSVQAAAQLHRLVAVGVATAAPRSAAALPCAHLRAARRCGASAATARIFSSARTMRTPNSVSNRRVHRAVVVGQALGGQALEQRRRAARCRRARPARRGTTSTRRTCTTASPVRSSSARAMSARRAHAAGSRGSAARAGPRCASPSSGIRRRKRYWTCCFGVRGDEGALALAAHQQVLGRQLVDRLAHRALAHLEARGQLDLARDRLRPASIRRPAGSAVISALICWYSGLNDGRRRLGESGGGGGHGGAACASRRCVTADILYKT